MIETIATIDILNLALDDLKEGKVDMAKNTLTSYRDKLQKEVEEFDKWAEAQSDIDTQNQMENEGK